MVQRFDGGQGAKFPEAEEVFIIIQLTVHTLFSQEFSHSYGTHNSIKIFWIVVWENT